MSTGWMGGWRYDSSWLGWAWSQAHGVGVWIGHARPGWPAVSALLGAVVIGEAIWLFNRTRPAETLQTRPVDDVSARLDKLTSALALLTDTTESGFTAIAMEVQQLRQKPAPARSRSKAVTKRAAAAAERGESVPAIAATESVSEDEINLRVALAQAIAHLDVPRAAAAR